MSKEFQNEVDQSLNNDRIKKILIKYKKVSLIFLSLVFLVVFYFQFSAIYKKNENIKLLESYTLALNNLNKNNLYKAEAEFKKIAFSNNDILSLLAINQLYEIQKKLKKEKEFVKIIDQVLSENRLDEEYREILKFKKLLFIFDDIDEEQLLGLVNTNKDDIFLSKKIKVKILFDYYKSKKLFHKANEMEKLLNGK